MLFVLQRRWTQGMALEGCMSLDAEFDELQRLFVQTDLLTEPRRLRNDSMKLLLVKRKNMKIKMYQEIGHHLPHIHID